MKVLIFGDIHIHNYKEFSLEINDVNSRLLDCIEVLAKIKQTCDEKNINTLYFLGDFFHLKNNLSSEVIRYGMDTLNNLVKGRKLIAVPGNHDYTKWSSSPTLLNLFEDYLTDCDFVVFEKPGWRDNIYIEPYTRKIKDLNDRLENLKPKKNAIFLGHQDIKGAQYGGFIVEHGLDAGLLSEKFRQAWIGHWHTPSKVRENVISVGAPLQHNFGDMGKERGWWIFDDEKNETEFIANDFSPQFREEIIDNLDEWVVIPNYKDFYRIKVKGTKLPDGIEKIKWKRVTYETETGKKERSTISFSDKKEDILQKYVESRSSALDQGKLIEIGRRYL